MAGLLGHISAEDREWMERESLIDSDRDIGPLGSHEDDDGWFPTLMSVNKGAGRLQKENDRLLKENEQLKKEIRLLKKRLKK